MADCPILLGNCMIGTFVWLIINIISLFFIFFVILFAIIYLKNLKQKSIMDRLTFTHALDIDDGSGTEIPFDMDADILQVGTIAYEQSKIDPKEAEKKALEELKKEHGVEFE